MAFRSSLLGGQANSSFERCRETASLVLRVAPVAPVVLLTDPLSSLTWCMPLGQHTGAQSEGSSSALNEIGGAYGR